jgi:hypothetical protein
MLMEQKPHFQNLKALPKNKTGAGESVVKASWWPSETKISLGSVG